MKVNAASLPRWRVTSCSNLISLNLLSRTCGRDFLIRLVCLDRPLICSDLLSVSVCLWLPEWTQVSLSRASAAAAPAQSAHFIWTPNVLQWTQEAAISRQTAPYETTCPLDLLLSYDAPTWRLKLVDEWSEIMRNLHKSMMECRIKCDTVCFIRACCFGDSIKTYRGTLSLASPHR